MKRLWLICGFFILGVASAGVAQNPPSPPSAGRPFVREFMVLSAGPMMESKIVTGAPYSAEAETEIRQTLADGNHIDHKETSWIYRDSAGRIRHERTLSMLGPMSAQGKMVTLFDPVAHVTYILDLARKTAYKITGPRKGMVRDRGMGMLGGQVTVSTMGMPGGPVTMGPTGGDFVYRHEGRNFIYRREGIESEPQSVSLGTRTIDGVTADGTRTTRVIPAGAIGNEKPITIVSERWYSPKLLTVVMTRRDDPRFGVITYQLTNIKLSEPAAVLFKVPAGYKIEQRPPRPRRFFREKGGAVSGPGPVPAAP
ncbi:MAG: hypothetical protein ACRD22_20465 [Terriglobia bacterium]